MKIDPTSIISNAAEIAEGVEIGPYSIIQGKVKIGKGTIIEGNVSIGSRYGIVEIGENNHFYPGSVIGGPPQDISYVNEATSLIIGDRNIFREFSTANIASSKAGKKTIIGSDCYIMSYTHVGHDCHIGNHIIIANNTQLAGHVIIDDYVFIGGLCAFNQFTRIGKHAYVAGDSVANKDILPFTKAQGRYAIARATNKIGLQRRGIERDEVDNIHKAIRIVLMGSDTVDQAIERVRSECVLSANINYLIEFIKSSSRGIAK